MITFKIRVNFCWYAVFIIALCGLAVGCSNGTNVSSSSDAKVSSPSNIKVSNPAENKQHLKLGMGASPATLDPHQTTDSTGVKILVAIFEPLLTSHPVNLSIQAGLAEHWQVSDSGLEFRLKLRPNIHWSNGDPIVASDVVSSWQRLLSPRLGHQYAVDYYAIKNAEVFHNGTLTDFQQVGIKALSSTDILFELQRPDPLFLKRLASVQTAPVNMASLLKKGALDDPNNPWAITSDMVSSGPFKVAKWILNQPIVVEKNNQYWDAANVKLDAITFETSEAAGVDERLYRSGKIHMTYGGRLSPDKMEHYRQTMPDQLIQQPAYATSFFIFNTQKSPFDKVGVRKAFALAVDKDLLIKTVTKNNEQPAYALTFPDGDYVPPAMDTYNPEAAREWLSKAGYANGQGFPKVTLTYNTAEMNHKVAVALQHMWKKILNIEVALENQEWKVFLSTRQQLQHQIARGGSISSFADPADFLDSYVTGHGMNDSGWSHSGYDQLIKQAAQMTDKQKRFEYLYQAEKILIDELPILPLYYGRFSFLKKPEVKGFQFNMADIPNYKGVYIDAH